MRTATWDASHRSPRARRAPAFGAKIAYACLRLQQNIVFSNLQLAFSEDLNDAEIRDLARAFYSHLIRSLLEFCTVPFSLTARRFDAAIRGYPELRTASVF